MKTAAEHLERHEAFVRWAANRHSARSLHSDFQDLAQIGREAVLKAARGIDYTRPEKAVEAYVRAHIAGAMRNQIRKERKAQFSELDPEALPGVDCETRLIARDELARVARTLQPNELEAIAQKFNGENMTKAQRNRADYLLRKMRGELDDV